MAARQLWAFVGFFSPDTVQHRRIVYSRDYEPGDTYRYIWQKTKDVRKHYLIYRMLHTLVMLLLLLISFFHILIECPMTENNKDYYTCFGKRAQVNPSWPFYLTRWGLMINFAQSLMGLILVWVAYVRQIVHETGAPLTEHRFLSLTGTYWGIHTVAVTLTILIDVIYWSAIHDYSKRVTLAYFNYLAEHAANFFLMIADSFIVAFPIMTLHVVHLLSVGNLYLIVTLIYYHAGGLDMNFTDRCLYPFLDWSNPLKTFGNLIFIFFFAAVSLFILMFFDLLKHKYLRPRSSTAPESDPIA